MSASIPAADTGGRLRSLDQFRGYCVVGMLLVNFLAGLQLTPDILEHHNTYFSYADAVLPAFLFAVGFALSNDLVPTDSAAGPGCGDLRVCATQSGPGGCFTDPVGFGGWVQQLVFGEHTDVVPISRAPSEGEPLGSIGDHWRYAAVSASVDRSSLSTASRHDSAVAVAARSDLVLLELRVCLRIAQSPGQPLRNRRGSLLGRRGVRARFLVCCCTGGDLGMRSGGGGIGSTNGGPGDCCFWEEPVAAWAI